ncbi:MAG: DMT family transporter, partial [Syntrophomonadaceae bacterium]|nr:DMT family transporter [Syntrophomonadaceae bacterium]
VFTSVIAAGFRGRNFRSSLARISKKDFLSIAGAGFFLALHFGFWITSLDFTSISSSVLFTNLQVIFVMLFSIFILKENLHYSVILSIIVAICGSVLIAYGDLQHGKFLGDMLALASGLFVAIYFIIGRDVRTRVDALTYTSITSFVAAIVLFIGSLAFGLEFTGYRNIDWFLFFLLALVSGVGGHAILNWALKYVKAPIVAGSILGESVGASILAYLFFREYLIWYQMIGGLFILTGIYMAVVFENKTKRK